MPYEREQPEYDELDERIVGTGDPAGDDLDADLEGDDGAESDAQGEPAS